MSAQILLFPVNRIRRLTCSGKLTSDMTLISVMSQIPSVASNCRIDLLYAVFDNALKASMNKK
ncbi:MAG: hypothetical protein EPN17_00905 [Methylobacter sp.]|nr:MAG: hypothetical protein EPN17_00905 [Methylobacter sp.]